MPAVSQNADLDPNLVIIVGPETPSSDAAGAAVAPEAAESLDGRLALIERLCRDGETDASPLRQMLGIILDDEISDVSWRVTPGYGRGVKVPWITIDLGRSHDGRGQSLAGRLDYERARVLAAMIGELSGALWMHAFLADGNGKCDRRHEVR